MTNEQECEIIHQLRARASAVLVAGTQPNRSNVTTVGYVDYQSWCEAAGLIAEADRLERIFKRSGT